MVKLKSTIFLALVALLSLILLQIFFGHNVAKKFLQHTLTKDKSTYKSVSLLVKNQDEFIEYQTKKKVEFGSNVSFNSSKRLNLSHIKSKIEKVMSRTRISLAFKNRAFDPLKILPYPKNNEIIRVIIATYFRAGSTFLGDILQQNWKTFYHFEPLHYISESNRLYEDRVPKALSLLSHLFQCNFSHSEYVEWAVPENHNFLFRRNHFLWSVCQMDPSNCFSPKFLAAVCERSPVQVMKITRLDLRYIQEFKHKNPNLKIKVIHLVRDPRGIISSRKNLDWCNRTECSDPSVLCKEMADDIQVYATMKNKDSSAITQIKYEDLSTNAITVTHNLYKLLNISYTPIVDRFLKTHTQVKHKDAQDPYSTRRNSSVVPFEWQHRMNYKEIEKIQMQCAVVLKNLGYNFFSPHDNHMEY